MRASAARLRAFAILVPILAIGLCLLAMEIGLRVAIFSDAFGIAAFQEPRHYADSWLDDDYWKLQFLLADSRSPTKEPEPGKSSTTCIRSSVGPEGYRRQCARDSDRPAL
jgi:hypothetical protein